MAQDIVDSNQKSSTILVNFNDVCSLYNLLQNQRCLVVDVRSTNHFTKSSILEAVNIPIGTKNIAQTLGDQLSAMQFTWKWLACVVFITDIGSADSDFNNNSNHGLNFIQTQLYPLIEKVFENVNQNHYYHHMSLKYHCLNTKFEDFFKQVPFLCSNSKISETNITVKIEPVNRSGLKIQRRELYPNAIILNKLYLGDSDDAENPNVMRDIGITHIVNCCPASLECVFESTGIKYCQVMVEDDEDQPLHVYFNYTCKFIENALRDDNAKVLVHCAAGISRSSTIVIAYLMYRNLKRILQTRNAHTHAIGKNENKSNESGVVADEKNQEKIANNNTSWGLESMLKFVENKRPIIAPNDGFMEYLKEWEKKCSKWKKNEQESDSKQEEENKSSNSKVEMIHPKQLDEIVQKKIKSFYNSLDDGENDNGYNNHDSNVKVDKSGFDNVIVVDIGDSKRFGVSRIRTSINIPVGTMRNCLVMNENDDSKETKSESKNIDNDHDSDNNNHKQTQSQNGNNTIAIDRNIELLLLQMGRLKFKSKANNGKNVDVNGSNNTNSNKIEEQKLEWTNPTIIFVLDDDKEDSKEVYTQHVQQCIQYICHCLLFESRAAQVKFHMAKIDFETFVKQYSTSCDRRLVL